MKRNTPPRRKNSGFTLIEMLIVVAIIAILVAVSIPIVGNSLERARQATDAANERSFKAELIICYLNEKLSDGSEFNVNTTTNKHVYAYDAVNGAVVNTALSGENAKYGKCNDFDYGADGSKNPHKGNYLIGAVDEKGKVSMCWTTSTYDEDGLTITDNCHNGTVVS